MKKFSYSLIFILSFIGIQAHAGIEVDRPVDFWDGAYGYVITSSANRTVSATFIPDDAYVIIPDTVTYLGKKFTVTSIGAAADFKSEKFRSITIPSTIDSINSPFEEMRSSGQFEVHISDLSKWCSVKMPYGLGISYNLYLNDKIVTDLVIPSGVTEIANYVFSGIQHLKSIDFGQVTTIGEYAFSSCDAASYYADNDSLTIVSFPQSLTVIGSYAFSGAKLNAISFNSATSVGNYAFSSCISLNKIDWGSGEINVGLYSFNKCLGLKEVVLSSNVKKLGNGAFRECKNLTSFDTGDGLTTIGEYAFAECSSLSSLKLGSQLNTISSYAFQKCIALRNVEIPSNITNFGGNIFYECDKLSQVKLPNNMAIVPMGIFFGCDSLKSIDFPSSVTTLGDFSFCKTGFETVVIPNSVQTIKQSCFGACNSLSSVTLGTGVKEIGDGAFDSNSLAMVASLNATPPAIQENTFSTITYSVADLNVPTGSIDAYKAATGWKNFASIGGGAQGDTTTVKQCATPVISYAGGKLSFTCATEGAQFYYTIEHLDNATNQLCDGEVTLQAAYKISVYASANGYTNSAIATSTISLAGPATVGDVDGDNKVNATDLTRIVGIILENGGE